MSRTLLSFFGTQNIGDTVVEFRAAHTNTKLLLVNNFNIKYQHVTQQLTVISKVLHMRYQQLLCFNTLTAIWNFSSLNLDNLLNLFNALQSLPPSSLHLVVPTPPTRPHTRETRRGNTKANQSRGGNTS